MKHIAKHGIYVIECLENHACYVGKGKNVLKRVAQHKYALRCGEEVPLLQSDWNKFGPQAFVFRAKVIPEPLHVEESECRSTFLLNAVEHSGGYNKALGRERGISARIRSTELKLRRARKFYFLPHTVDWARLEPTVINTFCQKNTPLINETFPRSAFFKHVSKPLVTNPMNGFEIVPD